MRVGFIVTCFNREAYWPHLRRVLGGYRTIRPSVVYCYNGVNEGHSCDVRLPNLGHVAGDMSLTLAGCEWLAARDAQSLVYRFVKLSVDSWPCDEQVLVSLFERMQARGACYAGNYWHHNASGSLSTDIFLADVRFGNLFDGLAGARGCSDFEIAMNQVVRSVGEAYQIPERHPVHWENRFRCDALKWTMSHRLEENMEWATRWGAIAEARNP